jgi:protein SCO1/2
LELNYPCVAQSPRFCFPADDTPLVPAMRGHWFVRAMLILIALFSVSRAQGMDEKAATYQAHGTIQEVQRDAGVVIVRHEEIPGYMKAMTMPFRIRDTNLFAGLSHGVEIAFSLKVTSSEGWIDSLAITGTNRFAVGEPSVVSKSNLAPKRDLIRALSAYKFTNEFGKQIEWTAYRGQAISLTFFFTSCPFPEFCPRLMKNFAEASHILKHSSSSPTNWHFLAVTIDPKTDTPQTLSAYGKTYNYDPAHWTFLRTDGETLAKISGNFGVKMSHQGNIINHSFYTAIISPEGNLQTYWPFGGDLSKQIAEEIRQACARSSLH